MNKPWSLSFIDQKSILYGKKGKLFHLDLKNKTTSKLNTIYLFLRRPRRLLMYSTMIKMYIYHTQKKMRCISTSGKGHLIKNTI